MPVFFTREYDYAIRICAYLAGKEKGEHIPISTLSNKLYISKPFATKIIYRLKTGNILETVQGKSGGAYLKSDPKQLSLYKILKTMGFESSLNECLKVGSFCPLQSTCKIHQFFLDQEKILIDSLKERKIFDFKFLDSDLKR